MCWWPREFTRVMLRPRAVGAGSLQTRHGAKSAVGGSDRTTEPLDQARGHRMHTSSAPGASRRGFPGQANEEFCYLTISEPRAGRGGHSGSRGLEPHPHVWEALAELLFDFIPAGRSKSVASRRTAAAFLLHCFGAGREIAGDIRTENAPMLRTRCLSAATPPAPVGCAPEASRR
jgi:hypothetical protein